MRCSVASLSVRGRSGLQAATAPARPARRVVRTHAAAANTPSTTLSKQQMEKKVHKWFESLESEDHAIEDLATSDARLIDNINQACYKGYPAMKHRMQSVHESLPNLVEVSDVVDTAHNCVAAHWVAQSKSGEVTGTYVFKFDANCMIEEVLAYQDSDEEEYLEA